MAEDIKSKVEKFKKQCERMEEHLNAIEIKLSLPNDDKDLDVTEAIKSFESELKELITEAEELKNEISTFVNNVDGMKIPEINEKISEFKTRLKRLKQKQLRKYNDKVNAVNEKISALKSVTVELDDEVREQIANLQSLSVVDTEVRDWRHNSYLDSLDYNKLFEVIKSISSIEAKMEVKANDVDKVEEVIIDLEKLVQSVAERNKDGLSLEEVSFLIDANLSNLDAVMDLEIKLALHKSSISEEKYANYLQRIKLIKEFLDNQLINLATKMNKKDNDFDELKSFSTLLYLKIDILENKVKSYRGSCEDGILEIFNDYLKRFDDELNAVEAIIASKASEGKLDENQLRQLKDKMDDFRKKVKDVETRLNDPFMMKDVDIFLFLDGQIDRLDFEVDNLDRELEGLEKPIKDKETKKRISSIIKKMNTRIKNIEKQLEMYKDEEPEKYKATKAKLEKEKEKLEKISKKYHANCPLKVTSVKDAKSFFKKHKKTCLVVAGLAALALVGCHVIIPAIMHGNLMIGASTPALRGFVQFTNNILGGFIGATKNVHGIWVLANGAIINPSIASTSLLKGLAISGIGTTALVAPLVVGVKKLVDKMKTFELKKKFTEGLERGREAVRNAKNKPKKEKNSKNKVGRETEDELVKLLSKYRKSGMSVSEFASQEELSDAERELLEYYDAKLNENLEKAGKKKSRR